MAHKLVLKEATEADLTSVFAHLGRHLKMDLQKDELPFAPFDEESLYDEDDGLAYWRMTLGNPVGGPHFAKMWGLFEPQGVCRGHLDLRSAPLACQQHRLEIGMGIERTHRQQGYGKALLQAGIGFAKAAPKIRWLDLSVFKHNLHAMGLYKQLGFQNIGETQERFWLAGHPIDDIRMTLFVGESSTSAK